MGSIASAEGPEDPAAIRKVIEVHLIGAITCPGTRGSPDDRHCAEGTDEESG